MVAVRQRSAVAIAVAALVVAFAVSFLVARSLGGDSGQAAAVPVQPLPTAPVSINNLERATVMKPLRTAPGGPTP